ncbi:hypothetical protein IQ07DRAFT_601963 [Pyrenochaeta sp. DS3sAY3a]|nr:hypothetical protein IQ07DRAFT_601963 [Pyrenochaeta sp. DS3sAY3a]
MGLLSALLILPSGIESCSTTAWAGGHLLMACGGAFLGYWCPNPSRVTLDGGPPLMHRAGALGEARSSPSAVDPGLRNKAGKMSMLLLHLLIQGLDRARRLPRSRLRRCDSDWPTLRRQGDVRTQISSQLALWDPQSLERPPALGLTEDRGGLVSCNGPAVPRV